MYTIKDRLESLAWGIVLGVLTLLAGVLLVVLGPLTLWAGLTTERPYMKGFHSGDLLTVLGIVGCIGWCWLLSG